MFGLVILIMTPLVLRTPSRSHHPTETRIRRNFLCRYHTLQRQCIELFRRKRYCILFNSLNKGVHLPGCSTDYDSWPTNIRINNSGSQSSVNRPYKSQSICKVNMRERRQYGSELVSIAWFKSSKSYGLVNCVVSRHNLPESITASIYYRGIYARLSICRPTPTELLQTMKVGRFVSERSN